MHAGESRQGSGAGATPSSAAPASSELASSEYHGEILLPEILADPIVQAVMVRDGVTSDELKGLMETMRGKLALKHSGGERASQNELGGAPELD